MAGSRTSSSRSGLDGRWAVAGIAAVFLLMVGHLVLSELRSGTRPETQFLQAVRSNDVAATREHLNAGMDVNHRYPNLYQTALHEVAWSGSPAMARLLLERGADPNLADGWTGETPLHAAVRGNRAQMVQLLLEAGADPQARIRRESPQCISGRVYPAGSSAIDIARIGGYDEPARLLERAAHRG